MKYQKNIFLKLSALSISILTVILLSQLSSCSSIGGTEVNAEVSQNAVLKTFGSQIDLNNLANYTNQSIPAYIRKDNTNNNFITDPGATLGRILFYDKQLSADNTIACASCHQQSFAFSDNNAASIGVNGTTDRHAMRLINSRFSEEEKFFWDERASTLEEQTTQPIQNHVEMGFSGTNGDFGINDLISKLSAIDYYEELFTAAFGNSEITEEKMQNAMAQFIRSIQSFDSKYDEGRSSAGNNNANFSNFTSTENQGKALFMAPPNFNQNGSRIGGGVGCAGCHRAPEFDIDPNSRNNGVVTSFNRGFDYEVTRAPSLRDIINPNGILNGNLMHSANFSSIDQVLSHYNEIPTVTNNLDNRLRPRGRFQQLNITEQERISLIAFIETLTGNDVYTNQKWADPFNQ